MEAKQAQFHSLMMADAVTACFVQWGMQMEIAAKNALRNGLPALAEATYDLGISTFQALGAVPKVPSDDDPFGWVVPVSDNPFEDS